MITPQSKLKEAILQCLEEINDALYTARQQGMIVLLPEEVDIEVRMVTGNDINVVQRTTSESESDGGQVTTTRRQTSPDTETQSRSGESYTTRRDAGSQGSEEHTINHPGVITSTGGGDASDETVVNTYAG